MKNFKQGVAPTWAKATFTTKNALYKDCVTLNQWENNDGALFINTWGSAGNKLITIPVAGADPTEVQDGTVRFARQFGLDCEIKQDGNQTYFEFRPKPIMFGWQRKHRAQAEREYDPSIAPEEIRHDPAAVKKWGANLILKLTGGKKQPAETDKTKWLSPEAAVTKINKEMSATVTRINKEISASITNKPNSTLSADELYKERLDNLGQEVARLPLEERCCMWINAERIEKGTADIITGNGMMRYCRVCNTTYVEGQWSCGCDPRGANQMLSDPKTWPSRDNN